jgi:uncharacterized protein (UPF0264 family)
VLVARLLVSVRSASEARTAIEGGAAVIDIKEPERGPLGRADASIWAQVRAAVPDAVPLSVALGELYEWDKADSLGEAATLAASSSFAYRKLGLAQAGSDWAERWAFLRDRGQGSASWIAVVYADWQRASAPAPDLILGSAINAGDCVGVLVDTWDKSLPGVVDLNWLPFFARAREAGLLTALAGRLDADAIVRLAPLRPDIYAVRGAACVGGNRAAAVDTRRVAELARAASRC